MLITFFMFCTFFVNAHSDRKICSTFKESIQHDCRKPLQDDSCLTNKVQQILTDRTCPFQQWLWKWTQQQEWRIENTTNKQTHTKHYKIQFRYIISNCIIETDLFSVTVCDYFSCCVLCGNFIFPWREIIQFSLWGLMKYFISFIPQNPSAFLTPWLVLLTCLQTINLMSVITSRSFCY